LASPDIDPAGAVRPGRCGVVGVHGVGVAVLTVALDHVAAFRPLADSRLEVEVRNGTRIVASRERPKLLRDRAV